MIPISSAGIHDRDRAATLTDNDGLSTFLSVRRRLLGIAYRMLGSSAAAEDVVQDVWLRWQMADRHVVRDAAAFLATTATRLAINVMQSAHSRRETCAGPWLPEPVDTSTDQVVRVERADALARAVGVLIERLSPAERAAYILREAFDYSYRDIAEILGVQEANARQLVTRARHHVVEGPGTPALMTERRRLLAAFSAATEGGDAAALVDLLATERRRSHRGSKHGVSVIAAVAPAC
jgi:RNA polymerase sigma factor (sigma-70 family)